MAGGSVAWALKLASEGQLRVFPLKPRSKEPRDKEFYASATSVPSEILTLFKGRTDYNVGILCDDLVVVDCDVKGGVDGIANFHMLDIPIDAFTTLAINTPSGGRHYYFSNPGSPRANSQRKLGPGIDTRGYHGYVVGLGSNLKEGVYTPYQKGPILLCPQAILDKLDEPHVKAERGEDISLEDETSLAAARYYLESRPGAVELQGGDKHTYVTAAELRRIGLTEVTAYDLMSEHWNPKCDPPWEEEELRIKVANGFRHGQGQASELHPALEFVGVKLLPVPDTYEGAQWTWHGEAWEANAQWLFYQMLPARGVVILTGEPGSGKSFLSTFIAEKLATGDHFFGTVPDERGGTIVLAAEAYGSLAPRLSVLGLPGSLLPIAGTPVSLLGEHGAWERMRTELKRATDKIKREWEVPVRLFILDTLSASGLILDENDNSQCAKAMKKLADLAAEFNVVIIVLHHPPKSGAGIRGGSALLGSADYVITLERYEGRKAMQVKLTKARDAEAPRSFGGFVLKKKEVGLDGKGRPVTTAYIEASDHPALKVFSPGHYDKFREAITWARSETVGCGVTDPVPLEEVRKQFAARVPQSTLKQFFACQEHGIMVSDFEITGKLGEDQFLVELVEAA